METTVVTPQSNFNNQSHNVNTFLARPGPGVWQHQVDAVNAIRDHFNRESQPKVALCVLPTGGGKTGVAVLSAYATNKSRVLVITPSIKISEQIYAGFLGNRAINKQSFLVQTGCVAQNNFFHYRPACMGILKKTDDIESYFVTSLIISNAHKFGTDSRIQIASIPKNVDLVIVDEAHHYPAPTWKQIVDHFDNSVKLFITATPKYKNNDILVNQTEYLCFSITREDLVNRGIIRNVIFPTEYESDSDTTDNAFEQISKKVKELVASHDRKDNRHFHQAMILCQTINDINSVNLFVRIYNQNIVDNSEKCFAYTGTTSNVILDSFINGSFRTLVIVGRLIEGFDHPNVSVVAIARNVSSQILFTQFVGRALRKLDDTDCVDACIVSDKLFNQRRMWETFETLPDDNDVEAVNDE